MIDHTARDAVVAELIAIADDLAEHPGLNPVGYIRARAAGAEHGRPLLAKSGPQHTFPAWTGTNASAAQLADLIREVDPYASVETETVGVSWQNENRQLVIDTVPNTIRLRRGDWPAFDGKLWSVVEAEATS